MDLDKIKESFRRILPSVCPSIEPDDARTIMYWLERPDSIIGAVFHAALQAGYTEGYEDGCAVVSDVTSSWESIARVTSEDPRPASVTITLPVDTAEELMYKTEILAVRCAVEQALMLRR